MKAWFWLNWWKNDVELFSYIEEYEYMNNKLKELEEEVWKNHSVYKEFNMCFQWLKDSLNSFKKEKDKKYLEKADFYINKSMNIDWIDDAGDDY